MTALTPNDRFISLSPGAGTTVLAYDFELMLAEGMSVTRIRAGVFTPLVLGVDFSFPGGIGDNTGGTLTLAVASLAADVYLLVGAQPEQRLSDFIGSQAFNAAKMNSDLDALTIVTQEHRRDIARAWKSAYGTAGGQITAGADGELVKFDAGNIVGSGENVEDILGSTATAVAAATAAAGSANAAAGSAAAAAASAGTVNLPAIVADTMLVAKGDASGYLAKPKADVRDFLDVAPYVATRTALKALDTNKDTVANLTEAGREGKFLWLSGDYSTQIAADTTEGLYVKATAIASTVGAWVRQFAGAIYSSWFGAVGDDAADNLVALTYAMARDEELIILPGTFRVSAALTYAGTGSKIVRGLGYNASVIKTTSATAHILRRNSASTLIVRDLGITTSVDKSAGAAVMLSGDGSRDVIDNCKISGASGVVALYHGVYGETTLIPTISRNYFLSCKADAVYLGRITGAAGCEAVVTGNTFNTLVSGGGSVAIYWDSGPGTLRIFGNTFQNYDYGILCQPLSSLTTAALLITGNAFEGTALAAIAVSLPAASTAAIQGVTVTGNRFNINATALSVQGATNPAFIGSVNFSGNSLLYGAANAVNVQAGIVYTNSGNTYYASSDITPIVVAASYPKRCVIGPNSYVNSATFGPLTIPYLLNGNTGVQIVGDRQFVSTVAAVTLSNSSTSAQNIFDAANDTLTVLANTTYRFKAKLSFNTGTTSHTTAFGLGGTATFSSIGYDATAISSSTTVPATPQMTAVGTTVGTAVVLTAASIAIRTEILIEGIIRTGAAGTIIPQVTFSAGPTGTCTTATNSYFELEPWGSDTILAVGAWS